MGQAITQLRAIADFFRRTEPHSPVSYFADKGFDTAAQIDIVNQMILAKVNAIVIAPAEEVVVTIATDEVVGASPGVDLVRPRATDEGQGCRVHHFGERLD